MFKLAVLITSVSLLSGCASTVGTFYHRPVVEDNVKDMISTLSLSADRRIVLVSTHGKTLGKFCAEPPPDTATGLKSELEASIDTKVKSEKIKADIDAAAKLNDKFQTNITVIADRTAPLDAFRTGVYALCQFNLNGAVADNQVQPLFEKMIAAFSSAYSEKTRSDMLTRAEIMIRAEALLKAEAAAKTAPASAPVAAAAAKSGG
jgi:hypothetical protein